MSALPPAVIADSYETMRAAVLTRCTSHYRQGLALLLREGMAAWIAATVCAFVPSSVPRLISTPPDARRTCAEPGVLIDLLASMTWSIVQESSS